MKPTGPIHCYGSRKPLVLKPCQARRSKVSERKRGIQRRTCSDLPRRPVQRSGNHREEDDSQPASPADRQHARRCSQGRRDGASRVRLAIGAAVDESMPGWHGFQARWRVVVVQGIQRLADSHGRGGLCISRVSRPFAVDCRRMAQPPLQPSTEPRSVTSPNVIFEWASGPSESRIASYKKTPSAIR